MKARLASGERYLPSSEPPLRSSEPARGATALLRTGVLAFRGSVNPTNLHAHHTVQILASRTPLTVMDASGVRHHGTHFIVPTDAPHRVETDIVEGTRIYLDPETVAGAKADRHAHRAGWAAAAHTALVDPANGSLADQVADAVQKLEGTAELSHDDPPTHAAVTEALRVLPEMIHGGSVRGTDIARHLGVAPTRLSRLFAAQMGIPLRPYILWLRLHITITRVRCGDDLTTAAHAAGFTDSTELTRTCRRTFGLLPTALTKAAQWDLDDTLT